MLTKLKQQVGALDRQRAALLAQSQTWTEEQLRFRPSPASWSALEVIDHVVKVEGGVLAQVQKSLPQGSRVTLRDRLGSEMIVALFRSRRRVKVPPSAAAMLPAEVDGLQRVVEPWSTIRLSWSALLETISPEQMRRGVFRHPVGGWMTPAVTLRFLVAHTLHHGFQLERLEQVFALGAGLSS